MVNGKYWNEKIETMPSAELKKYQLKKLKEQVKYCYENSGFYHKKFDEANLKPENIQSLDDLQKIPFTIKTDLRDNYPFGMVAAAPEDVVEIHASSGTTGNPIIGAYTRNDMDIWQELMARSIYTTGGRPKDVIHISKGWSKNYSSKRRHDATPNQTHERPRCHNSCLHTKLRRLPS
jgi:phenylacetate-CoA ligase